MIPQGLVQRAAARHKALGEAVEAMENPPARVA
jgi:hypothetical protein